MTVYETVKRVVKQQLKEEVPTNAAGGGAVASIGVGSQGEPPGPVAKIMKMIKRRRPNVNVAS